MNAGKNILSLVLLLLATGGCATVINGTTQTIYINSMPQGAAVSDNGRPLGMTPVSAVMARGQDHVLTVDIKRRWSKDVGSCRVLAYRVECGRFC